MHTHQATAAQLRLVFWETTVSCNLKCIHCRASAVESRSPGELDLDQSRELLKQIASSAKPVVVLSGGEPLVRADILDIARCGTDLGLRMVLATNGTLVDDKIARGMVDAGIQRVSISLDGADAATHDAFRGLTGSFDDALGGIERCKSAEMPVQINTTVAKHNIGQLPRILDLATSLGAVALHVFLLVPTGCGKEISGREMITSAQYEEVLNWLYDAARTAGINLKATCAPHYFRIMRQRAAEEGVKITPETHGLEAMTKGCLAGSAVCFVSHEGEVYPCGYFPVSAGNVLQKPLGEIWRSSELFASLRNPSLLKGKCAGCEFARVCGGCRARAYAETGDYLQEEPYCVYQPRK